MSNEQQGFEGRARSGKKEGEELGGKITLISLLSSPVRKLNEPKKGHSPA